MNMKEVGAMPRIEDIRQSVAALVGQYPIKRVSLFGSYAEERQTEASDIDLLVEFQDAAVSLLTISALKLDLEERLGVSVDILHAPPPHDAMIIPAKAVPLYE